MPNEWGDDEEPIASAVAVNDWGDEVDAEQSAKVKERGQTAKSLAKLASTVLTGGFQTSAPVAEALLTRGGKVGDIAAEVVPAIGGAVAGGLVAGPAGVAAGGAGGAATGNTLKQTREYLRGERDTLGKGELAFAAAAGAIPVPGLKAAGTALATVGKLALARGAQGGLVAGASETGRQAIDEEEMDFGSILKNTVIGAGLGTVLGGVEGGLIARRVATLITSRGAQAVREDSVPGIVRAATEAPEPPLLAPAAAEPPLLTSGPAGEKPLGLVESAKASPEIVPPLREQLSGFYTPQSNADTLAAATKQLDAFENLDAAKAAVFGNQAPDAVGHAMGLELVRKFQVENRLQDAADVLYDMALKAKSQGQAIQILSTLSKSTPEGMGAYATRIVGRPLTEKELADITTAMGRVQSATDPNVKLARQAQLIEDINSKVPATLGEKARAWQNIALLLNPKTVIRNIGGNVLMATKDIAADTIAPAADWTASIFTGQRTVSGPQALEYFGGLIQPARDFKAGFRQARTEGAGVTTATKEGFDVMVQLGKLTSGSKFEMADITKAYRSVFSNRYAKALEKGLSTVLGVPDRAFYTGRLRASLKDQMKAADAAVPTGDMLDRAHLEAARAVYQDENYLSKTLEYFRRGLNFGKNRTFGLGQVIIPYTRVPGSLVLRGLETSPLGFVKAFAKAGVDQLRGRNFDQRAFVKSFSDALTGTAALAATGYWLGKMGVITGADDVDPEVRALKEKMGLGKYRINVTAMKRLFGGFDLMTRQPAEKGDIAITYDWANPLAFPVALGADLAESEVAEERAKRAGVVPRRTPGVVLNAIMSGAKTVEEQPVLTGLSAFMRDAGNGGPLEAAFNSALSFPQIFTPTALRQIQQLRDNRVFETRGTDAMETAYRRAAANIPGVAEALGFKPRYDALGELAERYQANGNDWFNVLINPAFVTRVTSDPASREAYALWDATGRKDVVPSIVDGKITINGSPKILTGSERSDFQQYVGRLTRDTYLTLMRSPEYSRLPVEVRAEVAGKLLSKITEAAKIDLFGHRPKSIDTITAAFVITSQGKEPLQRIKKDALP